MGSPTPYIESNALLAVQCGDEREAERHLANLTDHELEELRQACMRLASLCRTWRGAGVEL